jgi:hypothetical protein
MDPLWHKTLVSAEPIATRDIALSLLVERTLDKRDQRILRRATKRVGVALRGQRASTRMTSRPIKAAKSPTVVTPWFLQAILEKYQIPSRSKYPQQIQIFTWCLKQDSNL